MKKTMFITSVIMVVVMAIALTTSSLAWFTATGSAVVTTNALTITAASQTSGGIQISASSPSAVHPISSPNYYLWQESVTLAAAAQTGMNPLVPLAGSETVSAAGVLAALSREVNVDPDAEVENDEYVQISPSFIGNYVGTNGVFAADRNAPTVDKKYTTGYFTKDVWVTNIASGTGAAAVSITPTIAFTDGTTAYAHVDGKAVLWVAVLGWTSSTDATGVDDNAGAWEIVALQNSSTTDAATINVGKTDDMFDLGDNVSAATDSLAIDRTTASKWVKGTSTGTIAAISGDGTQSFKHYRIVAWYDGLLLYNNNSGQSIPFVVTFTAS